MKIRRGKSNEIELGGQDSFLDLVSNIVGILIILVMVAGIRAQYSVANVDGIASQQMLAELETKYQEWQAKAETAANLRMDIEELHIQSEIVAEQVFRQSMEHAELFDLMVSVRAAIELAAEARSQTFKEKIEFQRQLMETNARLERIDSTKNHLRQIRPQATVLENTPTPMSQMVEGKEIHVRLLGGNVVYVPLYELIMLWRGHVGEHHRRLSSQRTNVGRVGPIDNFELKFLAVTHGGPMQGNIEIVRGELVPAFEPLGQPLRQALASPQTEFRRKLAMFHRDIYTVTVWVYADSFEEYQELKQFLQVNGYTVAARPMPMGHPIGISPHGSRSSTQ